MKLPDIKFTKLFINNAYKASASGKTFSSINPATGSKIADIQEAQQEDVNLAVKAARDAFKLGSPWRRMDASARGRLMSKLADLIDRDSEYIAALETLDNGRLFSATMNDMKNSANVIRYYAGFADKIHGKTIPMDGDHFTYTRMEPVGVCGQIIPWNFPVLMISWKLGPAFAAGNTVVMKPAEQTPLTCLYIASLVKEAGFPSGVFNVLPGFGETGQMLVQHPDVDKIAFTGSTAIGQLVQSQAGKFGSKRVSLEMGGKSPLCVFNDADLDFAVKIAVDGAFENQGQCCCAGTRTFVQEGVYDEFVKRCRNTVAARKIGDPYNAENSQGPQVDNEQFEKVLKLIETGKKEGAKLEVGGKRIGDKGYFLESTLFSDVTDDMSIAKEEIFGPVMQVMKFKTLDEVIERCNNTSYGLAAGIVSKDMDTIMMYSQGVSAGTVWVNDYLVLTPQAPFGGFKQSGHGRELGEDGLKEYCEVKTVVIRIPQKNS